MKNNLYLDTVTYDLILDGSFNLRTTLTYTEWLSQKIENTLKLFYGEWFAEQSLGIPYYESILKKQPNLTEVNSIFKNAIINIDGVAEIIKYEAIYDNSLRKYSIELEVRSDENEVILLDTITI